MSGVGLAGVDHLSGDHDMVDLSPSFKGAGFAGEPLGARMRDRLRQWGVEVYLWTSTGDVTAAYECGQHDGCHAWEDTVLLEAVDSSGTEPAPDGELGELVATSLDNPVTPLVRCRSGDIIRMTTQPCTSARAPPPLLPFATQ